MRSGLALAARLAFAATALASPAAAADAPQAPTTTTTEIARTHFRAGVKLYKDHDYAGALAEFEASYTAKPGPGSLQNVALCQKELRRYAEAVDSLTRLLAEHGRELTDVEREDAQSAKAELEALVGTVRLEVTPADADLTLDGEPFVPVERAGPVRVNVGEHTFAATAPGYSPSSRTVSVASGAREVVVALTLEPAPGSHAAAVAGKPEPPASPATPPAASGTPAPARLRPALGWYAMGSAGAYVATAAPFRFDLSDASSHLFGFGLRGGRRIRPPVAVEALVAYSALKVKNACDSRRGEVSDPPIACGTPEAAALDVSYTLRSVRFGPNVALMTTGSRFRLLGGLGLGVVWHELRCEGCGGGVEEKSSGVDGYFLAELGAGANARHMVMALALQTIIDGTKNMIGGRNLGTEAAPIQEDAYARSNRTVAYVGLELRLGWSEWAP